MANKLQNFTTIQYWLVKGLPDLATVTVAHNKKANCNVIIADSQTVFKFSKQ